MNSKIHSIVISSILAFALIAAAGGISTASVNVLAQEGAITPEGSINDTMSGENATQWANATLAFAQEGFTTEDLVNETIDLGNDTTMMNATLAFAQENDTGMTSEGSGNMTGMTQGQTDDDGDDGGNDDGDSEKDKDDGE